MVLIENNYAQEYNIFSLKKKINTYTDTPFKKLNSNLVLLLVCNQHLYFEMLFTRFLTKIVDYLNVCPQNVCNGQIAHIYYKLVITVSFKACLTLSWAILL